MDILAVLGRGIQQLGKPGGEWVPTEDLEVLDDSGAHSVVRKPIDDANPLCFVGGGELNLIAGLEIIKHFSPELVVCAFGHRAEYLRLAGGPTESEVMSGRLRRLAMAAGEDGFEMEIWPKGRDAPGPSNTKVEIHNILELAWQRGCQRVMITTVAVHMPRVALFTEQYLRDNPRYNEINACFFTSEHVLLEADSQFYGERVISLYASHAFQRNAAREALGIKQILNGTYGNGYEAWKAFKAENAQQTAK